MRTRAFRRHQAQRHMKRRLKEDRNEHYRQLDCSCWDDPKVMARFKEQPQKCSRVCCGNQCPYYGPKLQERRFFCMSEKGWYCNVPAPCLANRSSHRLKLPNIRYLEKLRNWFRHEGLVTTGQGTSMTTDLPDGASDAEKI